MMRRTLLLIVIVALGLGGCDMFASHKKPLPGVRISVLSLENRLKPDPALQKIPIMLPRPHENRSWPEAGGEPDHAMYHLALPLQLARVWRQSIGEGNAEDAWVLTAPVVAEGRVYAMDGRAGVDAYDAANGRRLWRVTLKPKGQLGDSFGGGLAYSKGRLFATTGYAQVLALDPKSGKVLWRKDVGAPIRCAPTVAEGRVFVLTVENQLEVLAAKDGRPLWSHDGIPKTVDLLGGASPAVAGEVVVVGDSSGELYALAVENGRQLWSHTLAGIRSVDAIAALADIHGRPVIDRDRVFAVGHSGRAMGIDLRTGERAWGQDIGGVYEPWVAGDYIYFLGNNNALICLTRNEGKIRWVRQLPSYENAKDKDGPIAWAGPVLASDRLIVLSSKGDALAISPYTGKPLGRISIGGPAYLSPVVAGNTLYILTSDAELSAYR
jgi:outer membrane protein assembly factor BamB